MSRLRRFPDHRFVGRRDEMKVYDCDDPEQFDRLSEGLGESELVAANLLQSFAPDDLLEAANRGFKSAALPVPPD